MILGRMLDMARGSDYFRAFYRLYRLDVRRPAAIVIEVTTIVTTPDLWVERHESRDPAWQVHPDCFPFVVATRVIA